MITLQDLSHHLEKFLSSKNFEDLCPNGVQVEGKREIRRIALAVSASLATISECVARKGDALIVHHGLFWQGNSQVVCGPKKKKLQTLLTEEISLLAYHLPLDAHQEIGNNWKAARDLGWRDLSPACLHGKIPIGVKGTFSPIPVEVFQGQLETYYGRPAHVALGGKKMVSSAAIVSGGAHRLIEQAIQEGVDSFITGSFDEPIWDVAHEQKIHFFALGHYATERVAMLGLKEELERQFSIPCEWIDFSNPF